MERSESEGDQGSVQNRALFISSWGWRWLILKMLAFNWRLDQVWPLRSLLISWAYNPMTNLGSLFVPTQLWPWFFSSPSVSGSEPRRKFLPWERLLVCLHLLLYITQCPTSGFHYRTGGDRRHGRGSNPLRLLDDVNLITRVSTVFLAMPLRYLPLCEILSCDIWLAEILLLLATFIPCWKRKQNQQWDKVPVLLNKHLKARTDHLLFCTRMVIK